MVKCLRHQSWIEPCFSRGQLCVACSRIGKPSTLFIYAPENKTINVVYRNALQCYTRYVCEITFFFFIQSFQFVVNTHRSDRTIPVGSTSYNNNDLNLTYVFIERKCIGKNALTRFRRVCVFFLNFEYWTSAAVCNGCENVGILCITYRYMNITRWLHVVL